MQIGQERPFKNEWKNHETQNAEGGILKCLLNILECCSEILHLKSSYRYKEAEMYFWGLWGRARFGRTPPPVLSVFIFCGLPIEKSSSNVFFLPNLWILCLFCPKQHSSVAPPWGTWLRTHYRVIEREKKAQHPAGFETMTSRVLIYRRVLYHCANQCSFADFQHWPLLRGPKLMLSFTILE